MSNQYSVLVVWPMDLGKFRKSFSGLLYRVIGVQTILAANPTRNFSRFVDEFVFVAKTHCTKNVVFH